jgi:alpha-L-fucosidase
MEKAAFLRQVDSVVARGPFSADWRSLETYAVPAWYRDAKLGIFLHWGVYAVPAFGNEWYPRNMYKKGTPEFDHHVAAWGPQSTFGYKDFIPLFKAEHFDPAAWAELFARAGARYVVPVAEHHDGFAMYDCPFSRWTAAQMGPRRDVVRDLAAAVRARGMTFGVSSHRAEHWFFMNQGRLFDSDVNDPAFADFYGPARLEEEQPDQDHMDDWLCRCCDLVDRLQPQVFWFDWWIEQPAWAPYLRRFAAYYYNRAAEWGRGVAINFKEHAFADGTAVYDVERGQLSDIRPMPWQTDTSVSKNSWGWISNHDYKTVAEIVRDLVDIVAKNGALLLNIGPKPDGTIAEPEQAILEGVGRWLSVSGEAIYDTRPWKVYGEGPTQVIAGTFNDVRRPPFTSGDIRFTRKGDQLYAIALEWPASGRWLIRTLAAGHKHAPIRIQSVELLGTGPLRFSRSTEGLVVETPADRPDQPAFALKIG